MKRRALSILIASVTPITATHGQNAPLPSRDVGIIRGWDVKCAMQRDGTAMVSCGVTRKSDEITVLISISRTMIYTVSKPCMASPDSHFRGQVRTGPVSLDRGGMAMMKSDLEALASSTEGHCVAQTLPSLGLYDDLRTVLMLIRPFPPSPENRGMWLD